jgi:hypothetical protein
MDIGDCASLCGNDMVCAQYCVESGDAEAQILFSDVQACMLIAGCGPSDMQCIMTNCAAEGMACQSDS